MKKIGKHIFKEAMTNSRVRKALELYLFVKHAYQSSTIPNFTYKSLSERSGLCFTSLKKRIATLNEMGLIERVGKNGQHLLFKSAKAKRVNMRIEQIDFSSIKSISKGLCALFIVEIQLRKEYIKQLLQTYWAYKKKAKFKCERSYQSIRNEVRKRGLLDTHFKENGISYKYIAQKIGISFSKVSDGIKYAVKNNILHKHTHIKRVFSEKGQNGFYAFQFVADKRNKFATYHGIYSVSANTYSPCMDAAWYGI